MVDGSPAGRHYDTQLQEGDTDMMEYRLGTVTVLLGSAPLVQIDGETAASQKIYKRLASYNSPAVNDRVMLVKVGGTYIILGKVV